MNYTNLQEDIKNLSSINQNQRKDLKDHLANLQLIDELRAKVSSYETVLNLQAQTSYQEKQDAKSFQEKIEKFKSQVEALQWKESAYKREIQLLKDELEIAKDEMHSSRVQKTQRDLAQMEFMDQELDGFEMNSNLDVSSYTIGHSVRFNQTMVNSSDSSSEDEGKGEKSTVHISRDNSVAI